MEHDALGVQSAVDLSLQVDAAAEQLPREANAGDLGLSPSSLGLPNEKEARAFASQVLRLYSYCFSRVTSTVTGQQHPGGRRASVMQVCGPCSWVGSAGSRRLMTAAHLDH